MKRREFIKAASGLIVPAAMVGSASAIGLVTQSGPKLYGSSGEGGGGDNPDSLPTGTTLELRTLASVDVGSDGPIADASPDVVVWTHNPTGGVLSAASYDAVIAQTGDGTVGIEQQAGRGLKWWDNSQASADAVPRFCLQMLIKFNSTFVYEFMADHTDSTRQAECPPPFNGGLGGYEYGGGKMVDFAGYGSNGTTSDSATRQLMGISAVRSANGGPLAQYSPADTTCPVGLYLASVNGGAGGAMCYDGTNTPYDFSDHPDVWHCVNLVADCSAGTEFSAIYVKRQGGPTMTKSVHRTGTMACGNNTGTFAYFNRGWCWPSLYNSFLWGYWQGIRNAHSGVGMSISGPITISTGWIPPPF